MSHTRILPALWLNIQDTTWHLQRTLHSTNTSEPSGTCTGTAKFTSRAPSTFVDKDGKLQQASREMLYTEDGAFQISTNLPKFNFSRNYVWRLNADPPDISIWFTKPGTEGIDYFFHAFLVQRVDEQDTDVEVDCSGGHLCVEDFYSSRYVFFGRKKESESGVEIDVTSWTMHHDVRGPKKEQSIETTFTRWEGDRGEAQE